MHPPKIQTFDPEAGTNTDSKGNPRAVDTYREHDWGLYLSRPIVGRPNAWWMETWVFPELGVCLSDWRWNPGYERDQDFYVDIAEIVREGTDGRVLRMTDLYLDLVVRTGREAELLDVDEYVAAVAEGLLGPRLAEYALDRSHAVLDALARHTYDVEAWLAGQGILLGPRAEPVRDGS
ncbi:DUF402 domain-containing protein [Pseudonocardia sp. KRD291]|uniref:DUF402 domain-containing protein n=1 Tax=Pseudonocardia sp. KRD291 TaxID=2792007 RepID=UPI0027E39E2A|nr:DUF402 domain-containing protein [Pseudonocardia sp. KRD291]